MEQQHNPIGENSIPLSASVTYQKFIDEEQEYQEIQRAKRKRKIAFRVVEGFIVLIVFGCFSYLALHESPFDTNRWKSDRTFHELPFKWKAYRETDGARPTDTDGFLPKVRYRMANNLVHWNKLNGIHRLQVLALLGEQSNIVSNSEINYLVESDREEGYMRRPIFFRIQFDNSDLVRKADVYRSKSLIPSGSDSGAFPTR